MNSFKSFQKSEKNLHLPHLEELVYKGSAYASEAIILLETLTDALSGKKDKSFNVSVKYDGAPSVVFGYNPENNKFFVGTKSVFSKDPKICYSEEDINKYYGYTDLGDKLYYCLSYLPFVCCQPNEIYQGDLLYISEDADKKNDGYTYFQPNTLTYRIKSNLIGESQIGVAVHTLYHGNSLSNLKIEKLPIFLKSHDSVFMFETTIQQLPMLTEQEFGRIGYKLDNLYYSKVSKSLVKEISENTKLSNFFLRYGNYQIKGGTDSFYEFIEGKLNEEINSVKMDDTKVNKRVYKEEVLRFLRNNQTGIQDLFAFTKILNETKLLLIKKLDSMDHQLEAFLPDVNGNLRRTGQEGYVISNGKVTCKLVNRMEFSKANFEVDREWKK